jgi:hypothetical protein
VITFTRLVTGLLLAIAAVLKVHQAANVPVYDSDETISRMFSAGVIELELFMSCWLLSGLWPRKSRVAVLLLFTVFSAISAVKLIRGDDSCGCLGDLAVHPGISLLLDTGVFVGLWVEKPRTRIKNACLMQSEMTRAAVAGLVFLTVGGVSFAAVVWPAKYSTLDDHGRITNQSDLVILRPKQWMGKMLPLLDHIMPADKLGHGHWIVVLHRANCSKCAKAIARYRATAQELASSDAEVQIALISIDADSMGGDDPHILYGCLRNDRSWFARTPTEIVIENGIVKSVSEDLGG